MSAYPTRLWLPFRVAQGHSGADDITGMMYRDITMFFIPDIDFKIGITENSDLHRDSKVEDVRWSAQDTRLDVLLAEIVIVVEAGGDVRVDADSARPLVPYLAEGWWLDEEKAQ